jgi:hypothetical protein
MEISNEFFKNFGMTSNENDNIEQYTSLMDYLGELRMNPEA